jgi:acyl-homoserine-lactone acylase
MFQHILIFTAGAVLVTALVAFTAAPEQEVTSTSVNSSPKLPQVIDNIEPMAAAVTVNPTPGTEGAAAKDVEILWDTWGTPHIFAQEPKNAFYAFGWAQMHSHGNLLLQLYAQGRGRAAEHFGEAYLPTDQAVRLLGIPTIAESWYSEQNPEFKTYLDAFAAGINDYAAAHPQAFSAEAQGVLPISGADVVGHTALVMTTFIVGNSDCNSLLPALLGGLPAASNGWALGPSYSASGHAMLLANPHLPWAGSATVYQAHIVTPEVDIYGNTLLGFPVLAIAFNNYLGWTHTVNTIDGCDSYLLSLAGASADAGYLLDGVVQSFETVTQTLKIKQADGQVVEEPFVIHRSAHGPVVEAGGQITAIRIVMLEAAPLPGVS